ncbi:MAG TPA: acetylxylan esterase, partial [Verrucomicrobiae bacterium]|nr:acetylxylan esterase [Verrucomicrobiae bacterium]
MKHPRWIWLGLLALFAGCATPQISRRDTGPWDMTALKQSPTVVWGERQGLTQALYYEGEPVAGKPTRVFAYLGRPVDGGVHPAMVLVHGGGGKAFKEWAEHWAKQGYVALAMDTSGQGPDGKHMADGAPDQSDATKFKNF